MGKPLNPSSYKIPIETSNLKKSLHLRIQVENSEERKRDFRKPGSAAVAEPSLEPQCHLHLELESHQPPSCCSSERNRKERKGKEIIPGTHLAMLINPDNINNT